MDTARPLPVQARFAEAVQRHMALRGVKQLELAEATGIPQATLSRRLRGLSDFKVTELDRIADYLGCKVEDLMRAAA